MGRASQAEAVRLNVVQHPWRSCMPWKEQKKQRQRRQQLLLLLLLTFVAASTLCWCCPKAAAAVPRSLCFERISTIPALAFQNHPGSSYRAVVAEQNGMLTLVSLTGLGARRPLQRVATWLDLRSRVVYGGERGLLGFAFHPQFNSNGRFFVSYICDSSRVPDCRGPCACNAAVGCSVGQLGAGCTSNTIVAEYWAGRSPRNATHVIATERRRLLHFARPFTNHNGGQIWFGLDGFLYYSSGDGGSGGDPFNFAQQGNTFLGKILRIDVNAVSPGRNYSVPQSNPFVGHSNVAPEVWALGLRNAWRCDQDRTTRTLVCGDVGQVTVEEVDIVEAGGNYGWRTFEGTLAYTESQLGRNTPPDKMIGRLRSPVFEYTRGCINPNIECVGLRYASVTGGVVYRAPINPCLQGKYLYNDLYGPMWVGSIFSSPRSTSRVAYRCAASSPIACPPTNVRSSTPLGSIWSWGKDVAGHAYVLSSTGVYRLLPLVRCGVACTA